MLINVLAYYTFLRGFNMFIEIQEICTIIQWLYTDYIYSTIITYIITIICTITYTMLPYTQNNQR